MRRASVLLLETNAAGFDPLGWLARGPDGGLYVDAERTLREALGDDAFSLLARHLVTTPALFLEDFRPWAAQVMLHQTWRLPAEPGMEPTEQWLRRAALAEDIVVTFLETLADQHEIVRQPDVLALPELRQQLAREETFSQSIVRTLDNCRTADLPALNVLAEQYADGFTERFLGRRIEQWMAPLSAAVDRGSAFVAVGAEHLAGPRGLLQRLRERGYVVTQLTAPAESSVARAASDRRLLADDTAVSDHAVRAERGEGAARAEWFSAMAALAVDRMCMAGSGLRECSLVDQDECQAIVRRSAEACSSQLAEVIPAWIDEVDSRQAWETFGMCVAGGYAGHLRARELFRETAACVGQG